MNKQSKQNSIESILANIEPGEGEAGETHLYDIGETPPVRRARPVGMGHAVGMLEQMRIFDEQLSPENRKERLYARLDKLYEQFGAQILHARLDEELKASVSEYMADRGLA